MKQRRVLVVDDEAGILHATERILGPRTELRSCRRPLEALDVAAEFRPELALLDVRMPEMDGFDLLARLKEAHPDLDVILMTGSVNETDAKLARAIREKAFFFLQKPFEREVLITLVERWHELRHLAEENRRHLRRLQQDLRDAAAFQNSMLPPERAEIAGVKLERRYLPCEDLGGDLIGFEAAGDRGAVALVADVSGHGVSAALLTGFVKSAFHAADVDDYAPLSVVERVQAGIRSTDDDRFITLFCARISAVDGTVEYVNAGHPDGLLRRADGEIESLAKTGPLVSPAFPEARWRVESRRLAPGDQLLLHTDGIEEVAGPQELFGRERLLEVLRGGRTGGALLDAVLEAVEVFREGRPVQDDRSLLVIRL